MSALEDSSNSESVLAEGAYLALDILHKAVASLSEQKSLDEFWTCVCLNARGIVPSCRMCVLIKDDESQLSIAARIDQGKILKPEVGSFDQDADIVSKVIKGKSVQWFMELEQHSNKKDELRRWIFKDKPAALITVPIKTESKTVGALVFVMKSFNPSDKSLLNALVTGYSLYVGMTYNLLNVMTDLQASKLNQRLLMDQIEINNANLEAQKKEINTKNEEIENANMELERFTYTVTHDLKTPLVSIKGFISFLEKDIAQKREDRVTEDLQHISSAAVMMTNLLQDLLELSRIGRVMSVPAYYSMSDLAAKAVDLLAGNIKKHQVEVEIETEMPGVYCDQGRLVEVYSNLIGNAVKFMGEQKSPRVYIGAEVQRNETCFYVRDNGVGISQEYLEKVFGLFQRLNPGTEGTGVGLTLARRIIEVHNGRLWVESKGPGYGSTFWFTLPQGV